MITLPASFTADMATSIGDGFAVLAPVGLIIGGLIAGFWLIKRVIGLIPRTK